MNMLTLGAAGIAAVLLAVWMKGVKAEYGIFVVIAAQLFFLFYGTGRLGEILDTVRQLEQYIKIRPVYLITLLKMTGITYSAEFASGIWQRRRICLFGKADRNIWETDDPGSEYAGPSGIIWHTGPDTYIGDLKMRKQANRWLVAVFLLFLFFQAFI